MALACFVVFNVNGRSIGAGDTLPARYLPFAFLKHHTLFLDPVHDVASIGRGDDTFWMLRRPDGRYFSLYPVVTPVIVTPLYVPAALYLEARGWTPPRLERAGRVMEKLSASLIAALSAGLLYLALRRRTTTQVALLLTVAYAFGTTTWVVTSQALWQHGLSQLMVAATLLLVTGAPSGGRALAVGLCLGILAGNRPPDAVVAGALGLYALTWCRARQWPGLLAAPVAPVALVAIYNLYVAGTIGGGYGLMGRAEFLQHDFAGGLAGLLVSPTRGLLVFSPFFVFVAWVWRTWPQRDDERRLSWLILFAVAAQVVVYAKADWRGGLSWGPRYMSTLLPLLTWLLAPVVESLQGVRARAFRVCVAIAIAVQGVGAFCYVGSLDQPIYAGDHGTHAAGHDMRAAWEWRHSPIVAALRHGIAPADLTQVVRGAIDRLEQDDDTVTVVRTGAPAMLVGWAVIGDASPWQVALSVDGAAPIATSDFVSRTDVRQGLGIATPSGWRIPFDTTRLTPGEHLLSVLVWSADDDTPRLLDTRTVRSVGSVGAAFTESPGGDAAVPTDLQSNASVAVTRVQTHQHASGYWLTAFTSGTTFRDARPEMNTFLTSLMVDVLDPLTRRGVFSDSVTRARAHLSAQIEPTGLVRYHGRPDGPGIGTLGCVITPDTDDTALVWRAAPTTDRVALDRALDTIARYRTPAGLYRTWLAPRQHYECLDPGHDPNPADIGIQMHLLMLLAHERPADAARLCEAVRRVGDRDEVWVYYRTAPLVPALRLGALRDAGCELSLPKTRLHTNVPEQQLWLSVARMIDTAQAGAGASDPAVARAVLREIARDDFAFIRVHPPLFYHNDLTATVPRFYWSEDLGYALWLRLYDRLATGTATH